MPIISALAAGVSAVAGAIGAGITAVTSFTVGGLALGKIGLQLALGFGLSALSSMLSSQKANKGNQQPGAAALTLQVGGDTPRQVVFGRAAVQGHMAGAWSGGTNNASVLLRIILSEGRCHGLAGLFVDGKRVTLQSVTPIGNEHARFQTAEFGADLVINFYDGRPGQQGNTNPNLYEASAGVTAADRFAGMCWVEVGLYNNDRWGGLPELRFELDGYRCYDPRKDSAVGGSGAHRMNDPATWEFTHNPALHVLNYLIGIYGEGQMLLGMGVQSYDLILPQFMAAANVCDETVTVAAGTEPRYRCSALVVADDGDHRSNLAPLLQAMAGTLVERAGAFGVIAGGAQIAGGTFTDNDIVWGAGVTFAARASRTDRVNELHGQFVSVEAGYQADSYPTIIDAAALAADGERLATSLDLGAVTSVTQAQRLASIAQKRSRAEASASLTLGIQWIWIDAGDWITWNSARYGARTYEVRGRALNRDGTVHVDLKEISAAVFTPAAAGSYTVPPALLPGPGLASTVSGFAATPDVIPLGAGSRPIVRLTWTPITDNRVIAVIIEYRRVGSFDVTRVRDDSPKDGLFVLDQPPTGTSYEYRATIATDPPRPVTWTAWVSLAPIDPATVVIDTTELDYASRRTLDDAALLLDTALQGMAVSMETALATRDARASLRRAERVEADANWSIAAARTELEAAYTAADAALESELNTSIATVSNAQTTTANAVTNLTSRMSAVDGGTASPVSLATVNNTATTAASSAAAAATNAATALARANDATANGQLKIEAASDGTTANALIKMLVSATAGGATTEAGIILRAIAGSGQEVGSVDLLGDLTRILRRNGTVLASFNATTNRLTIDGDLVTTGSIFGGIGRVATVADYVNQNIGSAYFAPVSLFSTSYTNSSGKNQILIYGARVLGEQKWGSPAGSGTFNVVRLHLGINGASETQYMYHFNWNSAAASSPLLYPGTLTAVAANIVQFAASDASMIYLTPGQTVTINLMGVVGSNSSADTSWFKMLTGSELFYVACNLP